MRIMLKYLSKIVKVMLVVGVLLSPTYLYYSSDEGYKISKEEQDCLIEALFFEARGLSFTEQNAILDVIINRRASDMFPKSFCGVIQQDRQFSYRNDLKGSKLSMLPIRNKLSKLDQKALDKIRYLVIIRTSVQEILPVVLPSNVLFYHSLKVKPIWRKKLKKIDVKGIDIEFKHKYYAV